MIKKLTLATAAVALALTLTACSDPTPEPAPTTPAPVETTTPAPVETVPEAEEVVVIDVVDGNATLPNGKTITCDDPESPSVVVKEDGTYACTTAEPVDW